MESVYTTLEDTSVENPDVYELAGILTIYDRPTGDSIIFEIINNQVVIRSISLSFQPFRKKLLMLIQTLATKAISAGSVDTDGPKNYSMKIGVVLESTKSHRIAAMTDEAAMLVEELLYSQLDMLVEHELLAEYDLTYDTSTKYFTLDYNTYGDDSDIKMSFLEIINMGEDPVITMGQKERYVTFYML